MSRRSRDKFLRRVSSLLLSVCIGAGVIIAPFTASGFDAAPQEEVVTEEEMITEETAGDPAETPDTETESESSDISSGQPDAGIPPGEENTDSTATEEPEADSGEVQNVDQGTDASDTSELPDIPEPEADESESGLQENLPDSIIPEDSTDQTNENIFGEELPPEVFENQDISEIPDEDNSLNEPQTEKESEKKISLHKSIAKREDGVLRLKYELQFETEEERDLYKTAGITVVFPEGQIWDAEMSDPNGQFGYAEIKRDDEAWQTLIQEPLKENPDKDLYSGAVLWRPAEQRLCPEEFVYYTTIPEDRTFVDNILPIILISAEGEVLTCLQDGGWENMELLEQEPDDFPIDETGSQENPDDSNSTEFSPSVIPDISISDEYSENGEPSDINDSYSETEQTAPDISVSDEYPDADLHVNDQAEETAPEVIPGIEDPEITKPSTEETVPETEEEAKPEDNSKAENSEAPEDEKDAFTKAVQELVIDNNSQADQTFPVSLSLTREEGYPQGTAGTVEILDGEETKELTAGTEMEGAEGLLLRFSAEFDGNPADITGSDAVLTIPESVLDEDYLKSGILSVNNGDEWKRTDVQCTAGPDMIFLKFSVDSEGMLCFWKENTEDEPLPTVTPEPSVMSESSADIIISVPEGEDAEFTFSYELTYPEPSDQQQDTGELAVKAGESKVLESVPNGTLYYIELIPPEGHACKQTVWSGTADGGENIIITPVEELPSIQETAAAADSKNKSYVSTLTISKISDGSGPFDSEEGPGNDQNNSNHVVRSFDSIEYTLLYTTALMDPAVPVDEGTMMVEFTLDASTAEARFNDELFGWVENKRITYHYADGTESTTPEKGKTVIQQVLTGSKLLAADDVRNPIPGEGTLSMGILVKASQNNAKIEPKIRIWMDGNEQNEGERKEQLLAADGNNSVTVSAAPRYNVQLKRNSDCDLLGLFDLQTGEYSSSAAANTKYGRLEGYGVTLQLYNDSQDKGLKGIELPAGDITFEVSAQETIKENGSPAEAGPEYTPILWDYRENDEPAAGSISIIGKLQRNMAITSTDMAFGKYNTAPLNACPASKNYSIQQFYCYNGGTISLDTGSGSNVFTVSGYDFDMDEFHFPSRDYMSGQLNTYGANIGCFSVGYVQFICQFPEEVPKNTDIYFTVEAKNLRASSVSGQTTTTDQNMNDNSSGMNIPISPKGEYTKENHFFTKNGEQIASHYKYGDAYAYPGQELQIGSALYFTGDIVATNVNVLQKFDVNTFDITGNASFSCDNARSVVDPSDVRVLYAAKPDKSGWVSESEMNTVREENLIYFNDVQSLNNAGYLCVGILYEVRDALIYPGYWKGYLPVKLREDAKIGYVYETMNDVRLWNGGSKVLSWTEVPYQTGGYGLGRTGGTGYAENYREPLVTLYNDREEYRKSVYTNGSITSGHDSGYYGGNSLLVVGCRTEISVQTNGQDTYNLDKHERAAHFLLKPSVYVESDNDGIFETDQTTDVEITVTLPPGLKYIEDENSQYDVTVVENEDGTSTVTWHLKNCKIGSPVPDIPFDCTIGDMGGLDDVKNGDVLKVTAVISSDKDSRAQLPEFKNYSETQIHIVQLESVSIIKNVEKPLVEVGDDLIYTLSFNNLGNSVLNNASIYDILPFNNDGRDTDFHGSYSLSRIVLDFTGASNIYDQFKAQFPVYTSTSATLQNSGMVDGSAAPSEEIPDHSLFTQLSGQTFDDTKKTVTWEGSLTGITCIQIDIATIGALNYLRAEVTLTPDDEQIQGDIYVNSVFEHTEGSETIYSNNVAIQAVKRSISGVVWTDENKNGIQDEEEPKKSNITVNLYSYNEGGMSTMVDSVQTDAEGKYLFEELPAGTYYIEFIHPEDLTVAAKDQGTDDTLDSDADHTENHTYIGKIQLPLLQDMKRFFFESKNNDLGLIPPDVQSGPLDLPNTGSSGILNVLIFGLILFLTGASLMLAIRALKKSQKE